MADHSVVAWNELYESEASSASVFCFENVSSEKVFLRWRSSLFNFAICLRVFVFLNATRREWNLPQERIFLVSPFASQEKKEKKS